MKNNKKDINSILLTNFYLTKCKLENNNSKRHIETTRKYLTFEINEILNNKVEYL
jgi:hypothetical protein